MVKRWCDMQLSWDNRQWTYCLQAMSDWRKLLILSNVEIRFIDQKENWSRFKAINLTEPDLMTLGWSPPGCGKRADAFTLARVNILFDRGIYTDIIQVYFGHKSMRLPWPVHWAHEGSENSFEVIQSSATKITSSLHKKIFSGQVEIGCIKIKGEKSDD